MYSFPITTEGIVVESANSGFKRMPVVLEHMRADEVLVEMRYSGICHTDIGASTGGYSALGYPVVLGHEGAGVVRAVGPEVKNPSLKVGTHVILSFNHCGACRNCSTGHPACCTHFEALNITAKRLDGSTTARLPDGRQVAGQFFGQSSFLRMSVVSQHSVVPCAYPEHLAWYAALGCGFQTGAGTILNALQPSVNDSVLIFGAGTVGVAAIMAAKHKGIRQIIAVDLLDEKLALARRLGATHTVRSGAVADVAQEILAITGGGARFAVDCTGASTVLDLMLDCVCCGGTAAVVGSPKPDFVLRINPEKLLHENKTLRGICQGDSIAQKFIPEMMELHQSGRFPVESLCTYYPVEKFEEAIDDVLEGRTLKAIIEWGAESSATRANL